MKTLLKAAGFEVKPLGNKSHTMPGKKIEDGGGYRIHFGNDGTLRYHPSGGLHKEEYWTVSNGERGKHQYDMEGNEKFF